ncbi:MAG: hypothetical protein ACYDCC_13595 [Actinomycetota bacterium]
MRGKLGTSKRSIALAIVALTTLSACHHIKISQAAPPSNLDRFLSFVHQGQYREAYVR